MKYKKPTVEAVEGFSEGVYAASGVEPEHDNHVTVMAQMNQNLGNNQYIIRIRWFADSSCKSVETTVSFLNPVTFVSADDELVLVGSDTGTTLTFSCAKGSVANGDKLVTISSDGTPVITSYEGSCHH